MTETPPSIPFNVACIEGNEQTYMAEAIAQGHLSGDGPFTRKCHSMLEKELGVPKVLLTTSCTHALEMSALLLDIQPGDEVIVPSFTFVPPLTHSCCETPGSGAIISEAITFEMMCSSFYRVPSMAENFPCKR